MNIQEIRIDLIDASNCLRVVDGAWVAVLAESIERDGLRQPVQVRETGAGFELVSGGHRLAACRRLGREVIECQVMACSELQARLAQIDENLLHRALSPLDRAKFLAERKKIYEALYPETRHGAAATNARMGRQNDKMSFCESSEKSTGLDKRTVERSVRLHNKLTPESRARLEGTWVAKRGGDLTALSKQTPKDQKKIIDILDLSENGQQKMSVTLAIYDATKRNNPVAIIEEIEKEVDAIDKAFTAARPAAKERWIDKMVKQGLVDRPRKRRVPALPIWTACWPGCRNRTC
ncbi:MAG: ParB N-terminal domain-containing protein [Magnetococcales bacterium]|nr:ParB N-terminal domain-containing protein [Magnetococcales bacterium]